MTKKVFAPTQSQLLAAYNRYQNNDVDEGFLCETFQWVRFDPRLGEILVQYLAVHWQKLNPVMISLQIKNAAWPQTIGVIGSHVLLILKRELRKPFRAWLECVLSQAKIGKDFSIFFIGIYSFAGKLHRQEVENSNSLYLRWGYYAQAPLIILKRNQTKPTRTFLSLEVRLQKFTELMKNKKRIRVSDYLECCNYQISMRTAEMDLKRWAQKSGSTKDATYSRVH